MTTPTTDLAVSCDNLCATVTTDSGFEVVHNYIKEYIVIEGSPIERHELAALLPYLTRYVEHGRLLTEAEEAAAYKPHDLTAAARASLRSGGEPVQVRVRDDQDKHDTIAELRAVSDDETWLDDLDATTGVQFTGNVDGCEWCVHVLWR